VGDHDGPEPPCERWKKKEKKKAVKTRLDEMKMGRLPRSPDTKFLLD
jgi:hypothetical protein